MSKAQKTNKGMDKVMKLQSSQVALFESFQSRFEKEAAQSRGKFFYQNIIKEVEKMWTNLTNTHVELLQYSQSEAGKSLLQDNYFLNDTYGSLTTIYFQIHEQASEKLQAVNGPVVEPSSETKATVSNNINLPKITLEKFNGNYLEWPSFHDLFKSLVHDNGNLTPAQKLHYLKMHLVGEPSHLLRHFQVTDNNYESAWEIIKDRYENKRMLVNNHLKRLFSQRIIQQEKYQEIRGLLDTTNECLLAIHNLGIDVEGWEPIIIFLTVQKLPSITHQLWEQSMSKGKDIPSWHELETFLENRFRALEAVSARDHFVTNQIKTKPNVRTFHNAIRSTCALCGSQHLLRKCTKFLNLNSYARLEMVKEKKLCINCLGDGHRFANCPSQGRCITCKKPHHSLLHLNKKSVEVNQEGSLSPQATPFTPANDVHTYITQSKRTTIILATALVKLLAPTGHTIIARALIDPGSQISLITEEMAQQLHLAKEKVNIQIHGVGENILEKAKARVKVAVQSISGMNETTIVGVIVRKITNMLPDKEVFPLDLKPIDRELADPEYYKPAKIDMLIGADFYTNIMLESPPKKLGNTLMAQQSIFGWILSGNVGNCVSPKRNLYNFHIISSLESQLEKFWRVENVQNNNKQKTEEEIMCENIYENSTMRLPSGKFQVSLPFRKFTSNEFLGASRNIALQRLYQLENRFKKNETFKTEYTKVIKEYIQLGHMVEVPKHESNHHSNSTSTQHGSYTKCYLPHHGVIKESSTTTKLRVVFDASRATESGISLNEMLLKGPVVQDDLVQIFTRWRKHSIAFTADVEKMYRQIWIKDEHADFQRIVWRDHPKDSIKDFKLLTVTFGTKSAPYLATRTIQQLAYEEVKKYPLASEIALSDFYVDDLLSGANDIQTALKIKDEIMKMMDGGGFPLRKWMSNASEVTSNNEETKLVLPSSEKDDQVKTLGIMWNPEEDCCSYALNLAPIQPTYSKREILSQISKLFDPLGWLTPVVIIGKIIMQKLWLEGLNWDDSISDGLKQQWLKYYTQLAEISKIRIPRWIQYSQENAGIELHVFADASIKAYAAVVYLCTTDSMGLRKISLVAAKSKVAPVKTISLPRLELCATSLAANLIKTVKESLKLTEKIHIYGWSDSEIVLAWLKDHPSKWTTFVSNRVSHIHEILEKNIWAYVPTKQNPADCASRGLCPAELMEHKLWWHGPEWLSKARECWPAQKQTTTDLEKRKTLMCHSTTTKEEIFETKFSKLSKLIRVIAYCKRFIFNSRTNQDKLTGHLLTSELQQAMHILISRSQKRSFSDELKTLKEGESLPNKNSLIKLNPFVDQNELLRVGGRLTNASNLNYNEKFPLILKDDDYLTKLIVERTHQDTLHGSTQLMLTHIRKKYWIINAKNIIRFHIHKCITCFKQKAETSKQLMGNLPSERVQMARPFSNSGLDYCGPFEVKYHKFRGSTKYKAYIALFICMATKAIHLELVSDMSSEGFISAFRRFCARRGLCKNIYCDNGTNFVGANKILTKQSKNMLYDLNIKIAECLENHGVTFHFNPPSSPHFGGLWEAGVKATKHHLKRILSNTTVTFEEFNTILCQIEACLNSRPLTEISADPQDLTPLTPAHFLIGDSMLSSPQEEVANVNVHRLNRWQYLQSLVQNFWRRWSSEYLSRLQQRPKWTTKIANIKPNQLVLLKEDNLPPCCWLLARIMKTHPGSDGLVRVVTLRTKKGVFQRPIAKICLLPDN